jgi:hypothetical protein
MVFDWGAFAFGTVIGWFTYFVNRHRGEVALGDVLSIVGAVGGGAVVALFPEGSALFSSYGIGLATGFFGYFLILVVMVIFAKGWSLGWFLDGRRPKLANTEMDGSPENRPMREAKDPRE